MSVEDKLWEDLVAAADESNVGGSTFNEWDSNLNSVDARQLDSLLVGLPMGGKQFTSVQDLFSKKASGRLSWPPQVGTRVAFSEELEAMFTYKSPPEPGSKGTVVQVRTAAGDATHEGAYVFVNWDSGIFSNVHQDHISQLVGDKQASSDKLRYSSLGDLTAMFEPTGAGTDLIHKATEDLWSLRKDGESFVIERLFNGEGAPLKL